MKTPDQLSFSVKPQPAYSPPPLTPSASPARSFPWAGPMQGLEGRAESPQAT